MNSCGIKIMIYVSVYWQKKTCPVCVRDSKSHPLLRASVSRKCFQISILFLQILIVHCIRCPKQSIVKLKKHFVFLTQWSLLVVSIGESVSCHFHRSASTRTKVTRKQGAELITCQVCQFFGYLLRSQRVGKGILSCTVIGSFESVAHPHVSPLLACKRTM